MNEWQQAIANLTSEDWKELSALNDAIQANELPWGETVEPIKTAEHQFEVGYVSHSALLSEFIKIWYEKDLVIPFDWQAWREGKHWLTLDGETKYDTLDDETALKLITAIIRNDRFADGVLLHHFDTGVMQKIINTFISNHS